MTGRSDIIYSVGGILKFSEYTHKEELEYVFRNPTILQLFSV